MPASSQQNVRGQDFVRRLAVNREPCFELYNCSKVRMTPLIRGLLRCTAAEAMESICAGCEQKRAENIQDNSYVAPSGRRVKVVVEDEAEPVAGGSKSSNSRTGFLAS